MSSMVSNIIVIVIVAAIVACIVRYLYKAKKRGDHCIGCPYGGQCQKESCSGMSQKK